jgi:hypothetical protein
MVASQIGYADAVDDSRLDADHWLKAGPRPRCLYVKNDKMRPCRHVNKCNEKNVIWNAPGSGEQGRGATKPVAKWA